MARNLDRERSIPEHELEISINEELRQEIVKADSMTRMLNKLESEK